MKKIIKLVTRTKSAVISILFTVLFTSSVTYANYAAANLYPMSQVSHESNIYNIIFNIIGFGIVILILGLILLLLIKVIRAIVFEAQDIKNDLLVKSILRQTEIEKIQSQNMDDFR